MHTSYQKGQILLVVVLLVTVVVTVGLSVAARSIVNVRLASEEDQSQRAFSAAEAGLDQSLLSEVSISNGSLSNNATYSTNLVTVQGTDFLLNSGNTVSKDEGSEIWLSNYSQDPTRNYSNQWRGTLTILWGSSSDSCNSAESSNSMAAVEVLVLTGNKNNPVTTHYVYDPCGSRRIQNNFNVPSGGGNVKGVTFANSANIVIGSQGLIARVIPLYANAYIGVRGNPGLPQQGTVIESIGTSGNIKRKITVLRENPRLPMEFFGYTFLWPK